ncbi:MAG: hypothetical protein ACWA5K_02680 [bacterium]
MSVLKNHSITNLLRPGLTAPRLLLIVGLVLLSSAWAAPDATSPADIMLVKSTDNTYHQAVYQTLQSELRKRLPDVTVATIDGEYFPEHATNAQPKIIIPIGSEAADQIANSKSDSLILNTLLPAETHERLRATRPENQQNNLSAVLFDQPVERIAHLAAALPIDIKTVATVATEANLARAGQLENALAVHNIKLIQRLLAANDSPLRTLRPLFKEADAFIVLPGDSVLNRALAKWILRLSFATGKPVIGFSKAYADAGALVSIYSTPEQIGYQTAEVAEAWLLNRATPPPGGLTPRYFSIQINPAVTDAMNIRASQLDRTAIIESIKQFEAGHGN